MSGTRQNRFRRPPFGTQCSRFDVSGVHPSKKKIGTFTEINHCKKLMSDLERARGPGKYEVYTGDFSVQAAEQRAQGPGKYEVYTGDFSVQAAEQRVQGPGKYEVYTGDFSVQAVEQRAQGPGKYEVDTGDFSVQAAEQRAQGPGKYEVDTGDFSVQAAEQRAQGPGKYEVDTGDFSVQAAEQRAQGPGKYEVYTGDFSVQAAEQRAQGPGKYEVYTGDFSVQAVEQGAQGPGKYEVYTGDFSVQAVEQRAQGPGWRRAEETALQARIPDRLYRDVWLDKRLLKTKLGPGSHDIPDFSELRRRRPCSLRGVCDSGEERLKDDRKMFTPGPGTYGKRGVPSGLLDEQRGRPVVTCPTVAFSARVERFPERLVDSGLCPGTYEYRTLAEDILGRQKKANLNPGTFAEPVQVLSEDLLRPEKRHQGTFSTQEQYPSLPSQRSHLASLAHNPRPQNHPGPGFYKPVRLPRVENRNPPPFLSSSPRVPRRTERPAQGDETTVGVGRYGLAEKSQRTTANAGHRYVFKSRIPRYLQDLDQDNYNQEKLRPMNLPPHCRVYYRPPDGAVRTTAPDSWN